jgi:Fe-S cluster biogenesis protein NfuA
MSVRTVLSFLIWSTFSSFLLGIKGQTLDPTHSPPSLSTIPTEAPTECTATLPIQFSTSLILTANNEETLVVDEVGSLLEEAIRVSYNTEMENTFSPCHPSFREVQSATLVNEEGSASSLTFNIIGACEACEPGSDIFDVISKDSVLTSLVSYIESRSTAVVISSITEVVSVPCEDSLQDFSEDVLIELLVDCPEGLAPDLQAVANAFVSTYNDLVYCDPYFRLLVGAEVVEVGQMENNTIFPIVLQVAGVCDGCDPSTVSIYDAPSSLNISFTLTDTSRRLVESRPAPSFLENLVSGGRDIAHESGHKQQRYLQSSCYCDAQALAERAPFESEFIEALQKSIQSMDIECVSSVRDCQFGSKFESNFVITLEGNETLASVEASLPALEDAFKAALNSLFEPTEEECNLDFRVVEFVSGRFNGFEEVDGLRRKTQEGPPDSVSSNSAPSSSPASTNPVLSPTLSPTISLDGNSPFFGGNSPSSSPTYGYSPSTSLLLLTFSGVCNGCPNDFFLVMLSQDDVSFTQTPLKESCNNTAQQLPAATVL